MTYLHTHMHAHTLTHTLWLVELTVIFKALHEVVPHIRKEQQKWWEQSFLICLPDLPRWEQTRFFRLNRSEEEKSRCTDLTVKSASSIYLWQDLIYHTNHRHIIASFMPVQLWYVEMKLIWGSFNQNCLTCLEFCYLEGITKDTDTKLHFLPLYPLSW